MLKNVNISRNDNHYKEIEEFEDYELTNCVAYEMAIRNNDYLKELLTIVEEYNLKFIQYSKGKYSDENTDLALKVIHNKEIRDNAIYNTFISGLMTSLRTVGINEFAKFDLFKIDQIQHFEIIKYLKKNYDKEELDLKEGEINIKIAEGFRIIQSGPVDKDETLLLKNEIIPDFKRPFLKFRIGRHSETLLNLALPLDELTKYLEIIKNSIDKDKLIKNPQELEEKILLEHNNKYALKRKKALLYADVFFAYDYFTEALKINKNLVKENIYESIDNEILYYYDSNNIGGTHRQKTTYRINITNMKRTIEEKGYLTLVAK